MSILLELVAVIVIFALLILTLPYFFAEEKRPVTYGRSSVTESGYMVKSNAEKIISDYLTQQNIHHKYHTYIYQKEEKVSYTLI